MLYTFLAARVAAETTQTESLPSAVRAKKA